MMKMTNLISLAGELHLINLSNGSYDSRVYNPRLGSIVHLEVIDENQLIVSSYDHNLFKIDLRFFDDAKPHKTVFKFGGHRNTGKMIKFSVDHHFQTLTSSGDDNCIRIWSIKSGELIRIIDFKDTCERILQEEFSDDFLLDEHNNQVFHRADGVVSTATSQARSSHNESTATSSNESRARSTSRQSTTRDRSATATKNLNFYNSSNHEQLRVVSSSNWACLKNELRTLMIGSISDSVDLFY